MEAVIPLGYVLEEFSFDYINSNFETKNSYRLKGNKKIEVHDKVDYWISLNSNAGNAIRDFVVNEEIFESCPVLSISHLPESISPPEHKLYQMYRVNQVFVKSNYYQKLKEITTRTQDPSSKYFNILSEFYERDEFNIDELTLTR